MSHARLIEIRYSIHAAHGWRDACTPEERAEIIKAWDRLPGHFSFYDVVCQLIRETQEGEVLS